MIRIENWHFLPGRRITGEVYGHSRLPDGQMILTGPVRLIELNTGRAITLHAVYKLGKCIGPEAALFPKQDDPEPPGPGVA